MVGKDLFKVCYPKSFKGSNKIKGSCLNIMVKRGSEVDLEYSKKDIIKKINTYFGYQAIERIMLNTFDGHFEKVKDKNPLDATKNKHINKIRNIKNDKIKNSLMELSKLFKKKWKKYY